MTRGRKPKPTAIKKLSGNPGKRPLNTGEPQFDVPGRMLNAPDFLDEDAQGVWRELGSMLLKAGLFTVVDKYALAMFASAAGRFIRASRKLPETGGEILTSKATGNTYQNPWLHVLNRAWEQMRQMFSDFGLTPAERARLTVPEHEKEPSLAEQLFALVGEDVDGD
jgi:P27 family predicted phage terminase small subunit